MSEENDEDRLRYFKLLIQESKFARKFIYESVELTEEDKEEILAIRKEIVKYQKEHETPPFNPKKALKELKSLDLPENVKAEYKQVLSLYGKSKIKGSFQEYIDKKSKKFPKQVESWELKPIKTVITEKLEKIKKKE